MKFNERKLGQFLLPTEFVEKEPLAIMALLQQVIPLRVEHRYDNRSFHYVAFSPEFRGVDDAEEVPYYDLNVTITEEREFIFRFMPQSLEKRVVKIGNTHVEDLSGGEDG